MQTRLLLIDLCLIKGNKNLEDIYHMAENGDITASDIIQIEKWLEDNIWGVKEELKVPVWFKENPREIAERRSLEDTCYLQRTFFPLFSEIDINERLYWLVSQLHMDYESLMNTPWEVIEWLYSRHLQQLIDEQKQRNQVSGINRFI